jgi:hypothetical protein
MTRCSARSTNVATDLSPITPSLNITVQSIWSATSRTMPRASNQSGSPAYCGRWRITGAGYEFSATASPKLAEGFDTGLLP